MAGNIQLPIAFPVLPSEAKHLKGTVTLRAIITKTGTISNLHVVKSSDPALTDAAMAGVQKWTYKPYLLNGKPVEVNTTITVNFTD
ncbi:MAG: energy transducer TonB [Acidobacteriaceae bacterium]|nr:energy transducer TonB [Acidobacteriaceae bacterium]